GVADLLERRLDAAAERALEVAEDHDRDRRVRLAPLRVLGSDWNARRALVRRAATRFGGNVGLATFVIEPPHEEHPCQEAHEEADDCGSFVHGFVSSARERGLSGFARERFCHSLQEAVAERFWVW